YKKLDTPQTHARQTPHRVAKRSMASAEITLACLLLGEKRPFAVRIDMAAKPPPIVDDLKEAIKAKQAQALSGIDAANLDLWQVNVPYTERATIREEAFKEEDAMGPLEEISTYFELPLPKEHIHVVARRPQ
ncbi:hypothetical protein HDU93_003889, partial [Gonapodya sp. JEL0774]